MLSRFYQFLGRHSYAPANVDDIEDGYNEDDEGRNAVAGISTYYHRIRIYLTNLGSTSFGVTLAPFGASIILLSLLFLLASILHTGTEGYAHPITYDYTYGNSGNNEQNYSPNNSTDTSNTSTSKKSEKQNFGEIIFSLLIFSIIISCLFGLSRLVAQRIRLIRERAIARGAVMDQLYSFQNDRFGLARSSGDRHDELAQMINMLYSNRDFNANDYEMLQRLDENTVHRNGVSDSALSRLPTHRYTADEKENNNNSKCSICLAAYEVNDSIKTITCLHSFHSECIDRWLRDHDICPVCKHSATGNS